MTGEGRNRIMVEGQTPNFGIPTVPRQASTVILLRGGDTTTIETLLVLRSPNAKFMADVWVFPGGAVDRDEQDSAQAHHLAALRELQEEAGVTLSSEAELVEFSRWITPAEVKIRFDTYFFLAELPPDQTVIVDGQECLDHRWMTPHAALEAHSSGDLKLVLPTIKHLERIAAYRTVEELLGDARSFDVKPVQPKIVLDGENPRILLPGEPGY